MHPPGLPLDAAVDVRRNNSHPSASSSAMIDTITTEELAELVRRTEEAAVAYIRGEMDRFLELTLIAQDFTLMKPTGGPAERYDDREESIRASADYFNGGEAKLESVETHAWGDTVVIAMIERQHGEVGGLPDQDWSLRVTHVYRRDGSDWQLVHRHADPLVRPMDLERMSAIAGG
jgi:ketosteroid isomerase-like protein